MGYASWGRHDIDTFRFAEPSRTLCSLHTYFEDGLDHFTWSTPISEEVDNNFLAIIWREYGLEFRLHPTRFHIIWIVTPKSIKTKFYTWGKVHRLAILKRTALLGYTTGMVVRKRLITEEIQKTDHDHTASTRCVAATPAECKSECARVLFIHEKRTRANMRCEWYKRRLVKCSMEEIRYVHRPYCYR